MKNQLPSKQIQRQRGGDNSVSRTRAQRAKRRAEPPKQKERRQKEQQEEVFSPSFFSPHSPFMKRTKVPRNENLSIIDVSSQGPVSPDRASKPLGRPRKKVRTGLIAKTKHPRKPLTIYRHVSFVRLPPCRRSCSTPSY